MLRFGGANVDRRRRENRGAFGAEGGEVRGGGVPLPAGDGVPSAPPEKIFGLFNVKMAYFGVFLRYLFESTGLQHKAV